MKMAAMPLMKSSIVVMRMERMASSTHNWAEWVNPFADREYESGYTAGREHELNNIPPKGYDYNMAKPNWKSGYYDGVAEAKLEKRQ